MCIYIYIYIYIYVYIQTFYYGVHVALGSLLVFLAGSEMGALCIKTACRDTSICLSLSLSLDVNK